MFKPRYAIIWTCVSFVLLMFVALIMEQELVKTAGEQVNSYVSLAADMALVNAQSIDDTFSQAVYGNNSTVGGMNGRSISSSPVAKLLAQKDENDEGYTAYDNIFHWYSGTKNLSSSMSDENYRNKVYYSLYKATGTPTDDAKRFIEWAKNIGNKVTTPAAYFEDTPTGQVLKWVNVPKLARMGTQLFPSTDPNTAGVINYGAMNSPVRKAILANKWMASRQTGVFDNTYYYLTPTSLGLTYVNTRLTGELFTNNMDLLMRAKYATNNGGQGLTAGSDLNYTPFVHDNESSLPNGVINNGLWSFSKDSSTDVDVEYMLVDVFDSKNNSIIEKIYGASLKYVPSSGTYEVDGVMTADKLKQRASGLKTADSAGKLKPATECYMIVAKVTFKADVIVRYRTAIFSGWRGKYDNGSVTNFGDLVRTYNHSNGTPMETGVSDSSKYEYTTYFAVKAV